MQFKIVFLFLLLLMMGCSPRELNVSFLSSLKTGPFFQVTNLEDGHVLRASRDETMVTIEAHCSPGVERIAIEDPSLDISTYVHDLKRKCADNGRVRFDLPTSLLHNYTPTAPGDYHQEITLRISGQDPFGRQPMEHREHLRVLYSPPRGSIMLPLYVNIRATEGENFSIRGRCEDTSDFLKLSGAFEGSPKIVACNGTSFEQNVKVIATTESSVSFTLESRGSANARTYMTITAPVSVDLTAPVLEITSLVPGTVFNKSATELGPLVIAGTCSEDLTDVSVEVWNGTILHKREKTACSATHTFEYQVPWVDLLDGVLKISVEQADLAHNNGRVELSIEKRTEAPGAFYVLGLSSEGTGDAQVDNVLKDLAPIVHVVKSERAVKYRINIFPIGGATSVCSQEAANLSITLSSCQLANQSQYLVKALSEDVYGNTFAAPDYTFTTSYVGSLITNVETTTAANAILVKDHFIDFTVYTDRPVKVSSLDSHLTLLMTSGPAGGGKAILVTPLNSVVSSLTYRYVVPVNVYSSNLKVQNISIGSAIIDSVTGVALGGAINPESGGNAHSVTAKNIVIDSLPPNAPEIFYTVSPKIATFSSVDYVAHNDGSGAITYLRMTNLSTSTSTSWRQGTNGSYQFDSPSEGIGLGVPYRIEAYTKDYAGNSSSISVKDFTSFSCPEQFAYVWNGIENPFCVAKFEGKGTVAAPLISPHGTPTIFTTVTDVQNYCAAFGAKYGVITNSQWQVLANLIVQQPTNWTGNNLLNGALKVGNVAGVFGNLEATDVEYPNFPNSSSLYSRKLNLPYAQNVWDLSGNASEFVTKDENVPFYQTVSTPVELLAGVLKNSYGARGIDCHSVYLENPHDQSPLIRCGFGSVSNTSSTYFMYRGSHAKSGESEAGVFTAQETPGVGAAARCVFNP